MTTHRPLWIDAGLGALALGAWTALATRADLYLYGGISNLGNVDGCDAYARYLPGAVAAGYTAGDHLGHVLAALLAVAVVARGRRVLTAVGLATGLAAVQLGTAVAVATPQLREWAVCGQSSPGLVTSGTLLLGLPGLLAYPLIALVVASAARPGSGPVLAVGVGWFLAAPLFVLLDAGTATPVGPAVLTVVAVPLLLLLVGLTVAARVGRAQLSGVR